MTDYFARLCGFPNAQHAIGETVFGLRCPAVELAPIFFQQDLALFDSAATNEYFNINYYTENQVKCFLTRKALLMSGHHKIGHETNNCELDSDKLNPFAKRIYNYVKYYKGHQGSSKTFKIVDCYNEFKLSRRESEIFYLISYGKTSTVIADLLNISPRTVHTHIESIKMKLNLSTKNQLIEFFLFHNLVYTIVKGLVV